MSLAAEVGLVVLSSVGTILFPAPRRVTATEQVDVWASVPGTIIACSVFVASAAIAPAIIPLVLMPVVVPTAAAAADARLHLNIVLEAGLRGDRTRRSRSWSPSWPG